MISNLYVTFLCILYFMAITDCYLIEMSVWLLYHLGLIRWTSLIFSQSLVLSSFITLASNYSVSTMKRALFHHQLFALITLLVVVISINGSNASTASLRNPKSLLQSLAVDRMLRDRPFVISTINCVLDKAPCDKHGRHLKRKFFTPLTPVVNFCLNNILYTTFRVSSWSSSWSLPRLWS